MTKTIKEFYQDVSGEVQIKYSDDAGVKKSEDNNLAVTKLQELLKSKYQ